MLRLALPLAIAAPALTACGSSAQEDELAPATQEELEALQDAASMLDEQRMPSEGSSAEESQPQGESQ